MNREYSFEIVAKLLNWGVSEFYVCAGARNFPLIETVLNIQSTKPIVFNHFEERSAAFYALGRIKALKKPVAVITTSGTAVGELLPAVMEAYYSGLPLVVITGDRPRCYRGTGAPQAAEQNNIFGPYVSQCFDLENGEYIELDKVIKDKPLHINVCFNMPLQSGKLKVLTFPVKAQEYNGMFFDSNEKSLLLKQFEQFKVFLEHSKNPLVVVSQNIIKNKSVFIEFLKELNCPVYFDGISGFRECEELSELRVHCAEKIWLSSGTQMPSRGLTTGSSKENYHIDSVIKIGGTPTHRFWRDLDESLQYIKVFSIHYLPFPGMPNATHITTDLDVFFNLSIKLKFKKFDNKNSKLFLNLDKENYNKYLKLINKYPKSEQSFFYYLSSIINKNSSVYLGNSMPIRYWDYSAEYTNKNFQMEASRGLNGIDGQISTCIGFASESRENWGIFGDLTTLYDLAAPWMLRHRPQLNINFAIINNSGGKIFSKLLKGKNGEFCQNTHKLEFKNFAKMWDLNYKKIITPNQLKKIKATGQNIFEIIPNNEQTLNFSSDWENTIIFESIWNI